MTTIQYLREIIDTTRSLSSNAEKRAYLEQQDRDILNFLSANIKKDGIAKAIASEILISEVTESSVEDIISVFEIASIQRRRKDKIRLMHQIILCEDDRDLILTILYGSLKLGLKIPVPDPRFGEVIKPQLCGTDKSIPYGHIIEEKFDGIRCIATNNNGKITLQSRNGKILNVPIIMRYLIGTLPRGVTVDGEIIASDGQFQSLDRKSNNLIYMIFDIIFINEEVVNEPFYFRHDYLHEIITENDHIKTSQILNLSTIEKIDNWIVETGAEGIIAKDPHSTYKYSDRKSWIKYKHFIDCTCSVIDYTEGTGKRKGIMGAINIIPDGSKVVTKVGSGFTDDQLIEMKQFIDDGKEIKVDVKFQNLTNDGALRFPIFLRIRTIDGDEI